MLSCLVLCFAVLSCSFVLQSLLAVMVASKDWLRAGPTSWGLSDLSGKMSGYCAHWGWFPCGGFSNPSVLRSPGVTLQEQAGRPMGPSTLQCEFPWELVRVCDKLSFFGSSSNCLFLMFSFVSLRGRWVFGSLNPSGPDPCFFFCFVCVPLFLICLVGFVDAVFSLSCSFSQALWKTQTVLVWVSPCVLFALDELSNFDPYVFPFTYTKVAPRTCFFFSSSSSLVFRFGVFLVFIRSVLGFLVGVFLSLVLVVVWSLHCMIDLSPLRGL